MMALYHDEKEIEQFITENNSYFLSVVNEVEKFLESIYPDKMIFDLDKSLEI